MFPLVRAISSSVMSHLARSTNFENFGFAALTSAYLGYEFQDDIKKTFSISAPSGLGDVPVTLPVKKPSHSLPVSSPSSSPAAPSLAGVLSPALSSYGKSVSETNKAVSTGASAISQSITEKEAANEELLGLADDGLLFRNQVEMKIAMDEVAFALNSQSVVHSMIYETLDRNLSLLNATLLTIAQNAKVTTDAKVKEVNLPVIDYTQYYERIAAHADVAKVREEFLTSETSITDLDGVTLAQVKPMELEAIKNASVAREKTDINSQEFDETDFNFPSTLSVLPFLGQSDIYSPNHTTPSYSSKSII
jgi:hypothetical protein